MSLRVSARHGFYAVGVLCFSSGTLHALLQGPGLGTLLESFIIWCLSVLILGTAYKLPDRDVSPSGRWLSFVLSVGVSASFTLLAGAIWLIWFLEGNPIEPSFLLSFASTLGAAVGARSSLYAVENEEHLQEARELAKLLTINQRVMRHNVRNELSIALGYLDDLETASGTEEAPETARIIRRHLHALLESADRSRQIVAIWESEAEREFNLTETIQTQVTHLREEYPKSTITTEISETCYVRANTALPLAIEEAIVNGIEHNTPEVTVTVSVRKRDERTVVLDIADTGQGISYIDRETINLSEETSLVHTVGLGLWTMYWVLEMSGGSLTVVENEPKGTIVRMILPQEKTPLSNLLR